MSAKTILLATLPFWFVSNQEVSVAGEWYVDGSLSPSGNGETPSTAFNTIQEAINAASDGDTVIVTQGTYFENIHFDGSNVVLTSTDPLDLNVVAATIIDGNQTGSVVTFSGTENETCVLSGFTVRSGKARFAQGGGICGGTRGNPTHATIENNVISGNSADGPGGGLAYCDGSVRNNSVTGNSATYSGGGLARCGGLIKDNSISDNSTDGRGGGLYECHGDILNNAITGNCADSGGGLALCQAIIEGNTISGNSAAGDGGGLYCCDWTIQDNSITANSANRFGGGLYNCDAVIQDNVIVDNDARSYGGGLAECDGPIRNNIITDNRTSNGGGALCECDGPIENNTITGNQGSLGGGLYECDGCIQHNIISGNSAPGKHGGGLAYCDGLIENNTITGNRGSLGGGLHDCNGVIENNTIAQNSAGSWGGGLDNCAAAIRNCIIWDNRAAIGPQLYLSSEPSYSCIEDWSGGGEGNIAQDPQFVDPAGGDLRLRADSACIDTGFNHPDLPETDISGMHRIMYGGKGLAVDMGAYEYYINELQPQPTTGETTLTWSSLADKTYSIFHTDDLVTWHLADDSILSTGDMTTSWTDDGSKTGGIAPLLAPRRFYRILENP